MAEISFFNMKSVSPRALMAQVAEQDDVDGLVMVVRRDGRWETCWSSKLNTGSLTMAAMLLHHRVTERMFEDHPDDESGVLDDPDR